MRTKGLVLAALAVVLVACGGPKPVIPSPTHLLDPGVSGSQAKTDDIKITGNASTPDNKLAIQAIADLQKYWAEEYPKLYGGDYKPVAGGFFAVVPSSGNLPPCAESKNDIAENAFYCATKDVVAWDSEKLLPELQSKFGDFAIPIVLAHEWGHAIQARSNFTARTVTQELQADCFAGGWAKHAQDSGQYKVNAAQLDNALAAILQFRDTPGMEKTDQSAHGSGFDRVSAFQDGYDNGQTACKAYRDDNPVVVELPFQSAEDEAAGGDMPYDAMVNDVPYDIEDYWAHVYPELTNGEAWVPVKGLEPFDPSNPPMCGGTSAKGYALFYCVPDDYIGWENDAMHTVYAQGGDYAVATLLATQFGLAAMTRANDKSDDKTQSLRGDCFAGSYTASVLLQNRKETSSFGISPGDLDEAITALLVFRGDGDVERQGAGFERIRHYRNGVLNGAGACLKD
jgi:predicted metalloprotease